VTWAQAILGAVIVCCTFSLSSAIRFAAERVAGAVGGNTEVLAIQNEMYLAAMDEDMQDQVSSAVDSFINSMNECNDPSCPVHA
jgi:hypothetical protein